MRGDNRILVWSSACMVGLLIGSASPRAENLDYSSIAVTTVSGDWQVSQANSKNECTIKLNDKPTQDKLQVGVPAPCKKPMKMLVPIASWALTSAGQILLMSAKNETLLSFERKAEGVYSAKTADGIDLAMKPVGGRYDATQRTKAVDIAIANVISPPARPNIPSSEAGKYSILRGGDKETGCTILLDTRQGSKPDLGRVVLENGCPDHGLQLFDPVGWHVEGKDRLFLTARKGHSFGFNKEKFGWNKDPVKGSPLKLVRQ